MKLIIKDEHQEYWVLVDLSIKWLQEQICRHDDWLYADHKDHTLKHMAYTSNYVRLVTFDAIPADVSVVHEVQLENLHNKYQVQWSEIQVRGAGIRFVTKIIDQFTLHESRVIPWTYLRRQLDQMAIAAGEEACL